MLYIYEMIYGALLAACCKKSQARYTPRWSQALRSGVGQMQGRSLGFLLAFLQSTRAKGRQKIRSISKVKSGDSCK